MPAIRSGPQPNLSRSGRALRVCRLDYHVEVDGHYYSVPYPLIHQQLQARYTGESVELFHKSKRVAAHARSYQKGHHTTVAEHRPPAHQKHMEWTMERILDWAGKTGPNCAAAVRHLMDSRTLPEYAFRPCLGLIRLGKQYGGARMERACHKALKLNIVRYRHIATMLKNGREQLPLEF